MNKIIVRICLFVSIVLLPLVFFLICGFCTSSKYSETYYGELSQMVSRLRTAEKNKIIIIGNSSVAFGVDSALIEEELLLDGLDYEVCNFGLYGSIGTKAMLDIAENYIKEGDIVVFSPEPSQQSMSLYFSATHLWYAADSDFSILSDIKDKGTMAGNFLSYVAEKMQTDPVIPDGVYAKASFDGHCDMKNANREYNTMLEGYDINNLILLDFVPDDAFFDYLNNYNERVQKKGAVVLYSFAPMNKLALPENYGQAIDDFYEMLSEKLDFRILGNPHDAVMDYEWFYDSNVHLNASGMQVRTISLINDLKLYFEKITKVKAEAPAKPLIPRREELTFDAADERFFVFEVTDNGNLITGLTEEGKQQTTLVLPVSAYAFSADTFKSNTVIEEITIPDNICILYDGSFAGCTALKKLILLQESPEKIDVGYSLLEGANSCRIYVFKEAFSAYSCNYFWGHYAEKLEIY